MTITIIISIVASLYAIVIISLYFLIKRKLLGFIAIPYDHKYEDFNLNEFVLELAEVIYCNNPKIILSFFNLLRNYVDEFEISTIIINEIKNKNNFIRISIKITSPKDIIMDIFYPIDRVINNTILEFQKLMIKPVYGFDIEKDIIVRKAPSIEGLYKMINDYNVLKREIYETRKYPSEESNEFTKLNKYLISRFQKVNFHGRKIFYLYEY